MTARMSRRFQVLPCVAPCLAAGCTWTATEADGGHEAVHAAASGHFRDTGHKVKVVMTRVVILGPAEDGAL